MLGKEVIDGDILQFFSSPIQNLFRCPVKEVDPSVKIDREEATVQALDDISVEGSS